LGPRSYSIIEQGMISGIIEARPEELRTHLEEAAGISKYKERRKETESRIRATRENLDRVRDVRDEVDKQLEHLKRQARAAERWKALKEEHKHRQGQLHALDYRDIQRQRESHATDLAQGQVKIEKFGADQRRIEAQLETARDRHRGAGEDLNRVQAEVYKVGAEIARIEQQVRHNRDLKERLEQGRTEAEREHAELAEHLDADREQADMLREDLSKGEPQRQEREAEQKHTAEVLEAAEARVADWQQTWETHSRDAAEVARAAEVERTRLGYLDGQAVDNARRREALENEQQAFDAAALDAAATRLAAEHEHQREEVDALDVKLDELKRHHDDLQGQEREHHAALDDARQNLQTARGRLASLEALQSAALGQDDDVAGQWLHAQGLSEAARVGASLDVDAGWETAVETVLAGMLDGVLVDGGSHAKSPALADLKDADMVLLDAAGGGAGAVGTLAAHVPGPAAITGLLGHVHTTADLAHALDDNHVGAQPVPHHAGG
jgi:chromosome segregation protein